MLALTVLALACAPAARAGDLAGIWLTKDSESQIHIERCGEAWCGRIVWLKEPNDPDTGRPWTDKANEDTSKRDHPIIGLQTVIGMKPAARPNRFEGLVYDPRHGKAYKGSLTLQGADRIVAEGCLLFLCESETWTRVEPAAR